MLFVIFIKEQQCLVEGGSVGGDGCLQCITDNNGENAPLISGALCDP